MPRPTFAAVAARQPGLWALLATSREIHPDDWPAFSARVKAPMEALVGWFAEDAPPGLRVADVYDVAYQRLVAEMGHDLFVAHERGPAE